MTDAKLFIIVYSLVGAYFSSKMIRLVLLLSPAACVNSGAFIGGLVQILLDAHAVISSGGATATATATDAGATARTGSSSSAPKKSAGGGGGGATNPNPKKGTKEPDRAVMGARPGTGAGGGGDGGDGDSASLSSELAELQQLWEENVEMRRSCPLMTLGMVSCSLDGSLMAPLIACLIAP